MMDEDENEIEITMMKFIIDKTWNNKPTHHEPIYISLYPENEYIMMEIDAPFFNDPAPNGEKGKPFPHLFNYEVVEAFFLGEDNKYLEVEFSPHGQHLLLLLSGIKNAIQMCLPVDYSAFIDGKYWHGLAKIPRAYFPPSIHLFNAYAIHGSGTERMHEALYPTPAGEYEYPDFHRLGFFKFANFSSFLPVSHNLSRVWHDALENSKNGIGLLCTQE